MLQTLQLTFLPAGTALFDIADTTPAHPSSTISATLSIAGGAVFDYEAGPNSFTIELT